MSHYIIKIGTLLAETIERTAAVQPAQFSGYWSNINFWWAELEHFVSISNGYEERARTMRDAYDRYIEERGGPHNADEFGYPRQSVWLTTTVGERKKVLGRLRNAFTRMAERALELGLIDIGQFDEFIDRLKLSERVK